MSMDRPERIGKYEVRRGPFHGGFGSVYIALDRDLDRTVAIKVPHPHVRSQPGFLDRFLREARILAKLNHPNIAQLYHYVGDGSQFSPYLVMEYAGEQKLSDMVGGGRKLSLGQVLSMTHQLCSALDYAHSQHVVHRDVKPSNIMFGADGRVKLTDFGIAKLAGGTDATTEHRVIGTPSYMSPEQCRGAHVDHRSDIYSLAAVVYEALSGARPFDGDTPSAILARQLDEPPPVIANLVADLPDGIWPALQRALAKDPARRQQTAAAFYQEMWAAVQAAPRLAAKPSGEVRSGSRHLVFAAAGAAVFLLVLVALGVSTQVGAPGDADRRQAPIGKVSAKVAAAKESKPEHLSADRPTRRSAPAAPKAVAERDRDLAVRLVMQGNEEFSRAESSRKGTPERWQRFLEAENCFTRAVAADSTCSDAWRDRSIVRARLRKWRGASDDCQTALYLRPDDEQLLGLRNDLVKGHHWDPSR